MATLAPATAETAAYSYAATEYAALTPSVQPNARFDGLSLTLSVLPGTKVDRSVSSFSCDVAWANFSGAGLVDGNVNFSYQNPYPDSWGRLANALAYYSVTPEVPGGGSVLVTGYATTTWLLDGSRQAVASPVLGPPRSVAIGGQAADAGLLGIGLTPEVTWSAPSLGEAKSYAVEVRHVRNPTVDPDTGDTVYADVRVARLSTAKTTLKVPAGILQAGEFYVFIVNASLSSLWVTTAGVGSYPTARTDAITGVVTP